MNRVFILHLGCLVVYFGDLILGFLARGDPGEGGGVLGFWIIGGDGVCFAVFGGLVTVMVAGVLISMCCWR